LLSHRPCGTLKKLEYTNICNTDKYDNSIPFRFGEINIYSINQKENKMADKNLVCKDCGVTFAFTEGEQAFYQEKGFTNEPQRCPDCRRAKKQRNNGNRDYRD
jgi:hypothetical protein